MEDLNAAFPLVHPVSSLNNNQVKVDGHVKQLAKQMLTEMWPKRWGNYC